MNQVRVSFYVDVDATDIYQIDKAMEKFTSELEDAKLSLVIDNPSWDLVRVPRPLSRDAYTEEWSN
jgi:hypothetical protein